MTPLESRSLRCGFCGTLWDGERCDECGCDLFFEAGHLSKPHAPAPAPEERHTRAAYLVLPTTR